MITFTPNGSAGYSFDVGNNYPADANLRGQIDGTFSFQNSAIQTNSTTGVESVNVTGTGSLVINDNLGTGASSRSIGSG